MQQRNQHPEPVSATEPTTSRLRTVTGNRFPRRCACGCGLQIQRDLEVRYVVDFGAPKPYPAYLREHSPDYHPPRSARSWDSSTALWCRVP
jgi:hypothetical protein